MRVKTYRGPNTKSVLARIKAELGSDAVILGTRTCAEEDGTVCEVTAALEDPAPQPKEPTRKDGDGAAPPLPESWSQWHQEWSQIKDHLNALLRPQLDFSQLAPIQRQALEYLEREGVEPDVVMQMFGELKGQPKTTVLTPLERMIKVRAWGNGQWPETFHAVAGPHGAGKTQALLRMALESKQNNDALRICLVNADTRRMKNRVVLQHYAELSGLEYREISEPLDTAELLRRRGDFDLVLVDLPALERGKGLDRQLAELGLDAVDDLQVHLVFSPHFAPSQLRAFLEQYKAGMAASLVWTKLDESYTFGAMVNTAWASGLPVSALSYGSGLSGTLSPARHLTLWRLLFKHKMPNEARQDGAKTRNAPNSIKE